MPPCCHRRGRELGRGESSLDASCRSTASTSSRRRAEALSSRHGPPTMSKIDSSRHVATLLPRAPAFERVANRRPACAPERHAGDLQVYRPPTRLSSRVWRCDCGWVEVRPCVRCGASGELSVTARGLALYLALRPGAGARHSIRKSCRDGGTLGRRGPVGAAASIDAQSHCFTACSQVLAASCACRPCPALACVGAALSGEST